MLRDSAMLRSLQEALATISMRRESAPGAGGSCLLLMTQ
jgi:hypothetical protein